MGKVVVMALEVDIIDIIESVLGRSMACVEEEVPVNPEVASDFDRLFLDLILPNFFEPEEDRDMMEADESLGGSGSGEEISFEVLRTEEPLPKRAPCNNASALVIFFGPCVGLLPVEGAMVKGVAEEDGRAFLFRV